MLTALLLSVVLSCPCGGTGCTCAHPGACHVVDGQCISAFTPTPGPVAPSAPVELLPCCEPRWWTVTNHPGWEAFGTPQGGKLRVVLKWRRAPVRVVLPAYYPVPSFAGFGFGGCANGSCGMR